MLSLHLYSTIIARFPDYPYPKLLARIWARIPLAIAKARLSQMRHQLLACESHRDVEVMALIVATLEQRYD